MSTDGERPQPIILDGHQAGTPYQAAPGVLAMREPSKPHAAIRGAVAGFLVLAGIVNFAASTGFPSAAPVEVLFMFLISLDMFLGVVALAIFAVLAGLRRSMPVRADRTSPLSIAALSLSVVPFAAWLGFALIPTLVAVASDEPARYMTEVGAMVLFGIPWILGIVFGAISLRSGGPRTAQFGGIALALGLILVVASVAASILYGAGLTE